MKPRPFTYLRPASVAEAVEALSRYQDDARVIAGGQTLMAMMNLRVLEPAALIDIARLDELSYIRRDGDWLEVGAAVTQSMLLNHPSLAQDVPLLAAALPWVGHVQTRNRGTVCGSIAHSDPSAELPLSLALLRGEVVLRSARGTRTLTADRFQLGVLSTARHPDEVVVAARFPCAPRIGAKAAFREVSRRHGDFAILSVGAVRSAGDVITVGVGGMAPRPLVRDLDAAALRDLADFANRLAFDLQGTDDIHASAHYRRDLVRDIVPALVQEVL
jgi:2-furoyl-CoA dehydrogenase FAD binding subunit